MDVTAQRTQAHILIDSLPQDSLEIVVALLCKLTDLTSPIKPDVISENISDSYNASLANIRALAGCFSACQSKDWKEEKTVSLQEKYH